MLYLPLRSAKIFLVILASLLMFHIILISTEKYFAQLDHKTILLRASKMQYQTCLNELSFDNQLVFINKTQIKYIFDLPEYSILIIYIGYFVVCSMFIFSIRTKIHDDYEQK